MRARHQDDAIQLQFDQSDVRIATSFQLKIGAPLLKNVKLKNLLALRVQVERGSGAR